MTFLLKSARQGASSSKIRRKNIPGRGTREGKSPKMGISFHSQGLKRPVCLYQSELGSTAGEKNREISRDGSMCGFSTRWKGYFLNSKYDRKA